MLFLLKVTSKISCGCREIGIRQFDQFYIIQMAPNDTLNSIVYNYQHAIYIKIFPIKCSLMLKY